MARDITVEELYEHPIVQQLLNQIENQDLEAEVKIPYVIKDKVLMSPGTWNGLFYSPKSIDMAYHKSDFDSKEIRSLFLDHEDANAKEWVGDITNIRIKNGHMIGDLVIIDKQTAMKLHYGAKFGISPKLHGTEDGGRMLQFVYDNFSIVINPAVKTAYINNSEGSKLETKDIVSPQAVVESGEKTSQGKATEEEVLSEKQNAELNAFTAFAKDFLKENPGKSIKDARAALAEEEQKEELAEERGILLNEEAVNILKDILSELKKGTGPELAAHLPGEGKKKKYPYPDEKKNAAHIPGEDKKKKRPYPEEMKNSEKSGSEAPVAPAPVAPTQVPAEKPSKTEAKLSDQTKEIEELKRKLAQTEAKLTTPAVETVRTEKLKKKPVDPIYSLLTALRKQGGLE